MENNAKIKISGLQKELSDEPTVVECVGSHIIKSGHHYIRYEDSDGVRNTVKISPDGISVSRTGKVSSRLDFREGLETVTAYDTGYGVFETVVFTEAIRIAEAPGALSAEIIYMLTMNGQHISRCILSIESEYSSQAD